MEKGGRRAEEEWSCWWSGPGSGRSPDLTVIPAPNPCPWATPPQSGPLQPTQTSACYLAGASSSNPIGLSAAYGGARGQLLPPAWVRMQCRPVCSPILPNSPYTNSAMSAQLALHPTGEFSNLLACKMIWVTDVGQLSH